MNDQDSADYTYIEHDLNKLAEVEAQFDQLMISKAEMIQETIPPDVKLNINDIEDEFAGKLAAARDNINQLRNDIKEGVIYLGRTVQGEHIMATWNKGRTSWDAKALNGYAAAHPSLDNLRKTGKPTVSIRKVK